MPRVGHISENLPAPTQRCFHGRVPLPRSTQPGKTPRISRALNPLRRGRDRTRWGTGIPQRGPKQLSLPKTPSSENKTPSRLENMSGRPQTPLQTPLLPSPGIDFGNHGCGRPTYRTPSFLSITMTVEFRPGVPVQASSLGARALLPIACSQYEVLSVWTLPRRHIHCQVEIRVNNKATFLPPLNMTMPLVTNLTGHSLKPMENPLHEHNNTPDIQESGSEAKGNNQPQLLTAIRTDMAGAFECNCLVILRPRSQMKVTQLVLKAP
jgi:hypothetical protein